MPLSRFFSRRGDNRTDPKQSSSRSLSSSIKNTMSSSKPPYPSDSAQGGSASAAGPPPTHPNPFQQQPLYNVNPFNSQAPPTRRPDPSQQQGLAHLGGDAPPSYNSLTTQTPDDPYAFLTNFDTVFLIDDSGSMAGHSWMEVSQALSAIAPICTSRDKDGVDLYFLNNRIEYKNVTTTQGVQEIFSQNHPRGQTFTGTRLRDIIRPYLARVEAASKQGIELKPMNIIVITDGAASDDVESVIVEIANKLEKVEAPAWQIGIQFFQVGRERGAADALRELDDDLVKAGCPRDIVDTVPWNKDNGNGGLSADGVLKVVLGSVNRKLDRKRISGEKSNAK